MLKTRVITAIVLLAVLLPITFFAPVGVFAALIAVRGHLCRLGMGAPAQAGRRVAGGVRGGCRHGAGRQHAARAGLQTAVSDGRHLLGAGRPVRACAQARARRRRLARVPAVRRHCDVRGLLACAGRGPYGRGGVRAIASPSRMAGRHWRILRRKSVRPAQARAVHQSGQNLGRRGRRLAGGHDRRLCGRGHAGFCADTFFGAGGASRLGRRASRR